MNKKIGYIGLGKMGMNMSERLLESRYDLLVTDTGTKKRDEAIQKGFTVFDNSADVVKGLNAGERIIWIMVPQQFVDNVLDEITPILDGGDIVIDGGNSRYAESIARARKLKDIGVHFLDVGVSGGPDGARNGACTMIGGEKGVFEHVEQLFKDVSVDDGYKYVGRSGAGHYVKMVHNGIEYGMMEAIAEGFNIMKESDFNLNMTDVANIYSHKSVISGRLINWLKQGFKIYGEDLDAVSGSAGASGEGAWVIDEARKLGLDAGAVKHALEVRLESQREPSYHGKLIQTMRNMFGGHVGKTNITQ